MLSNIVDRIKLPFRKDRELISSLYEVLGFYPHKMAYYKLALMHKSLGHRSTAEDIVDNSHHKWGKGKGKKSQPKGLGRKLNNERLEFLGDAILDAVVGDIVYHQYPGKPEGFLTNTRSKLVQRETLGKLAQQMGLSKLILSSGRSASHNSYMGGNAFEALVGAVYLDRGYDACYKFWNDRVLGKYLNIDKVAYKEVNFKSKLIEWTQKNRIELKYELTSESKDTNGSPTFEYTVFLETVKCESGSGFSKKESQQHASEKTLKRLKADKDFLNSIFEAKTQRTQMDEDMINVLPSVEPESPVIIQSQETDEASSSNETHLDSIATTTSLSVAPHVSADTDAEAAPSVASDSELSFDDIDVRKESSREDIIAAAEAAAYSE